MEEITKAAEATYANFSAEEKREVEELFRSMDRNGDGRISFSEFRASSEDNGEGFNNRSFFDLLDQSGDGTLQFGELLTLSYIRASGRPTCDCCGNFISGLFFTCTHCRLTNEVDGNGYNLCIPCYRGREYGHEHTEFVDNYTLLAKMQEMLSSGAQTRPTQSSGDGSRFVRMKDRMQKAFRAFANMLSVAADVDQLAGHFDPPADVF